MRHRVSASRVGAVRGVASRGVALVLVIIALAVGVILSVSYVTRQSTAAPIAQNIVNQSRARFIAESGMAMTIREISRNSSWRSDHPNGVWVDQQPHEGGVIAVSVQDGTDVVNGVVTGGDGDLADDASESVVVTVTGAYDNTTYTIHAVLVPNDILWSQSIAVSDKVEVKNAGVIDGWDSSLGTYAQTKGAIAIVSTNSKRAAKLKVKDTGKIQGDTFAGPNGNPNVVIKTEGSGQITGDRDTLPYAIRVPGIEIPDHGVNVGDVSYNGGTTVLSSDLHCNKLTITNNATLQIDGQVSIHVEKDFKVLKNAQIIVNPGGKLTVYTGPGKAPFQITDNALVNTDSNDPERVVFYRTTPEKVEIMKQAQVYATFVLPLSELKVRENSHVYGSVRAKKVMVENNGQLHNDIKAVAIKASDVVLDYGGADYGLAGDEEVVIANSAIVQGFGVTARLSVNSLLAGKFKVKDNATATGDVFVPPTADPSTVVKTEGSGQIIGTLAAEQGSVDIFSPDVPDVGASSGNATYSAGTTIISSNMHVGKFTMKNAAIVQISGDVIIVVDDQFTMDNTSEIQLLPGATLSIYLQHDGAGSSGIIQASAKINANTSDPSRVSIHVTGMKNFEMFDTSVVYANLSAVYAEHKVLEQSRFYGTSRARKVKVEDTAQFHATLGLGEGFDEQDTAPAEAYTIRWIEDP